jgi:putative NIF3 family GTP cyclohydrolase 1 type 2
MTTPRDIIGYVEALTGHPIDPDEGLQHGADCHVHTATVAWMATPSAIQATGAEKSQLLIAHESLYYPYDVVRSANPPPDWQKWQVNRQRRAALEQHELTLLRLHFSVDEICIFDTFAELLELGSAVFTEGLVKVYEIPPCPLHALVERVKDRIGMPHLRVADAGDMDKMVSRIGLPWGGMGLFVNVDYQQRLIAQECDVFIAGESDNYGFRLAAECGIPMIETSHELSENPGLHRFTEMLGKAFPDVQFTFYENECVWRIK